MIRIFVAEDQPLFLQDITTQILGLRDDLMLCGTAYNGEDALNQLRDQGADIVFTDIKMPRLSGLELMAQVKEFAPQTKFVVISGYQDYEYMHKAIQLEADEYLLKPVVAADIRRVVNDMCTEVLAERERVSRSMVERVLFSHASEPVLTPPDWEFRSYFVWLLNAGPCVTYGIDALNPFAMLWDRLDLELFAQQILGEGSVMFSYPGPASNARILFWGTNRDPAPLERQLSRALIRAAGQEAVPLTIGISRQVQNIEDLRLESQVIQALLKKNLVFGKSAILPCGDPTLFGKTEFRGLSAAQEGELKRGVEQRDAEAVKRMVLDVLKQEEQRGATQRDLQHMMNSMLLICTTEDSAATEDYLLLLEEALCNARNYQELAAVVLPMFVMWRDQSAFACGGVSPERLYKARQYIGRHFREPITISEVAAQFHIEPSYFSRMFKKEFGVTAIEYLTSCRIDQAKELLKGRRAVRDVAALCGYQDQFYFSRMFKKATGLSPSEFQQDAEARTS